MSSPSLQSPRDPPAISARNTALGISAEAGDGGLFAGVCGVKKPVVLSPSGLGSSGQGLSVLISASPRGELEEIKPKKNVWWVNE